MVIGLHLGRAPVSNLVGLAIPESEGVPLLILEDDQGLLPGGAMHAMPSNITTPTCRFLPQVGEAAEAAALEEALPHVLDASLHLGLVLGVTHAGRIGDEAAVL